MSVPLYQRAKAICSCYTDSFTVHHPFLMQEYGVAAAAAGDRLSFEVNALVAKVLVTIKILRRNKRRQ